MIERRAHHCFTCTCVETVDDSEVACEATIVIGSEKVGCFGSRQHPGQPHAAILCDPCICCGQFDECDESCVIYPMEPSPKDTSDWWFWNDGDLTVTRAGHKAGQAWRDEYQPDSPYARKSVAA